jgi:hypothetical protein
MVSVAQAAKVANAAIVVTSVVTPPQLKRALS